MTIIIISHRLKAVEESDTIFVLSKGEVVENGTHEQLIKNKKLYYKMYNSQ